MKSTRAYTLTSGATLVLSRGDITTFEGDAIVNAANHKMLGGGGVDGAIHRAAGPELRELCAKIPEVKAGVRCPTGQARLTRAAGDLLQRVSHVIHGVGPRYAQPNARALLASVYRAVMQIAVEEDFRTLAFPAISCGVYRFPLNEAAAIALREVSAMSWQGQSITFVLFEEAAWRAWVAAAEAAKLVPSPEAPVLECSGCETRLTGFRCRGARPPQLQATYSGDSYYGYKRDPLPPGVSLPVEPAGCGRLLEWREGELVCPEGCGSVLVSCREHGPMNAAVEGWSAALGVDADPEPEMVRARALLLTCVDCGWSVDGVSCAGGQHRHAYLYKCNGAIERIWCHYAWSCPQGCGRAQGGGLVDEESLRCGCSGRRSVMRPLDYLENHGPPVN